MRENISSNNDKDHSIIQNIIKNLSNNFQNNKSKNISIKQR